MNIAVEGIRDGKQISYNSFKDIKITFPNIEEQEKIASFLTLIDKKIEKQKELVELLKKYKRGLLSSIFSQKLRFKDDNGNDYPAWEEKSLGEVTCNISYGLNAASKIMTEKINISELLILMKLQVNIIIWISFPQIVFYQMITS